MVLTNNIMTFSLWSFCSKKDMCMVNYSMMCIFYIQHIIK